MQTSTDYAATNKKTHSPGLIPAADVCEEDVKAMADLKTKDRWIPVSVPTLLHMAKPGDWVIFTKPRIWSDPFGQRKRVTCVVDAKGGGSISFRTTPSGEKSKTNTLKWGFNWDENGGDEAAVEAVAGQGKRQFYIRTLKFPNRTRAVRTENKANREKKLGIKSGEKKTKRPRPKPVIMPNKRVRSEPDVPDTIQEEEGSYDFSSLPKLNVSPISDTELKELLPIPILKRTETKMGKTKRRVTRQNIDGFTWESETSTDDSETESAEEEGEIRN